VIPWKDVALDEGTGIVHIAPGAGAEDFELSRVHDLPVLAPIDEGGRFLPGYGPFEGFSTEEAAAPIVEALQERGLLVEAGTIVHRYPICWRCKTPLVFRVVDDWFIGCDELRQPLLDANQEVEWTRFSTGSGWTTGSATWATGTSRGSATSACRFLSTRATAGT
jgi:isoleucyl-tRNA synthetase